MASVTFRKNLPEMTQIVAWRGSRCENIDHHQWDGE